MQDAAYNSLLKSRKQELHGKIARVIEARFRNVKTTEPEVLAYHYTEAKQLAACRTRVSGLVRGVKVPVAEPSI